MLVAFLLMLYISVILYIYGSGVVYLFTVKSQKMKLLPPHLLMLVGLMAIVTLASFASLLIRIHWEFQVILVLGAGLLYLFIIRPNHLLPKIQLQQANLAQMIGLVFLAVSIVVILYQSTLVPANPDTGIYHAQAIHWIESYPAVPGLGNLHQRLGYGSSWLMGTAVFSLVFLKMQSFHLLTAVLFLIMAAYFYGGIHELLAKKFTFSNLLKMGFFAGIFIFLPDQVSSPGTDSPTTLLIWYIISEVVTLLEKKSSLTEVLEPKLLFLLSFYALTVKISAAPILLLALFWWGYFLAKKHNHEAWTIIGIAAIIVLPFVARNIIQTGYPVFPGFPLALFHFDWAIPISSVRSESKIIHWFATLPRVPIEEFNQMSFRDQTVAWFANQSLRHKALLIFIPAAIIFNLLLMIFRAWRKTMKESWPNMVVYFTVLVGCLFWFFSAPAIRFGYGFLLAAVCLSGFPLVIFLISRIKLLGSISIWIILLIFVGVVSSGAYTHLNPENNPILSTFILPADYPNWSSEPCEFGDFKILCQVSFDSCWYSSFPCAVGGNRHVFMRGNDFGDGFYYLP